MWGFGNAQDFKPRPSVGVSGFLARVCGLCVFSSFGREKATVRKSLQARILYHCNEWMEETHAMPDVVRSCYMEAESSKEY